MIADYTNLALGHLKRKKLRSALTVIGIFISIATIFILISLSVGLNNAVKEQFRMLGTDKFFIQPKGQAGGPGSGGAVQLTIEDVNVVKKVNGVDHVAYVAVGNAKIEFQDQSRYYLVMGLSWEEKETTILFESMNIKVDEGRLIKKNERGKVIIGYNYKYGNLFKKPVRAGDKIKLNGVEFEVVGIFSAVGNAQDDQQVYISYDDFKQLFNSDDRVDVIYVQIKSDADLNTVAEKTKKRLMDFRGVKEKTIDFTILTPEELLASFGTVLNVITVFLLGVAGISLLVGGIGIANTMYTSVLERTKEIGVMKAIGAKNSDILLIFAIEAGTLGLIGGLVGVGTGIGIGKLIDFIAATYLKTNLLNAATPLWLVFGCLGFAFFIGVIFGYLPARQASRIRPADTLRYE